MATITKDTKLEGTSYTETRLMKIASVATEEIEITHSMPRHPNWVCVKAVRETSAQSMPDAIVAVCDEAAGHITWKTGGVPASGTGKVYLQSFAGIVGAITEYVSIKMVWSHSTPR